LQLINEIRIAAMPWMKGQSGNPYGKTPDKVVTDAIRVAAMRRDRNGKAAVRRMAEKIMSEAVKGKAWACHFVADRLDGRVPVEGKANVEIGPSMAMVELLRAIGRGEFVGKEDQILSAQSLIEHGRTSAE
jgi:uncharacterized protein DUF5681